MASHPALGLFNQRELGRTSLKLLALANSSTPSTYWVSDVVIRKLPFFPLIRGYQIWSSTTRGLYHHHIHTWQRRIISAVLKRLHGTALTLPSNLDKLRWSRYFLVVGYFSSGDTVDEGGGLGKGLQLLGKSNQWVELVEDQEEGGNNVHIK